MAIIINREDRLNDVHSADWGRFKSCWRIRETSWSSRISRSIKEIVFEQSNSRSIPPRLLLIRSTNRVASFTSVYPLGRLARARQLSAGLIPNRIHLNTWPSCPLPPFNSRFYELLRPLKALGEKLLMHDVRILRKEIVSWALNRHLRLLYSSFPLTFMV